MSKKSGNKPINQPAAQQPNVASPVVHGRAEARASDITLVNITEAFNLLTLDDVRKLSGLVLAELRRRAAPVRASDATRQREVKPVNRSREHMAAMRAAKNARRSSRNCESSVPKQAKPAPSSVANVPAPQPQSKFAVRKPDGSITRKTFATASEASVWLASWVNSHAASEYSVVGVA